MISWRFSVRFPKHTLEYRDILHRVRTIIIGLTRFGQVKAMEEAPGNKLKRDISRQEEQTEYGQVGAVLVPSRLAFTYQGTQRHFIPGPAVSRSSASAMQMAKGYPLRFYWERVGKVVTLWSVDHPGIQDPDPWDLRVIDAVQEEGDKELGELWGYINRRWGGVGLPAG